MQNFSKEICEQLKEVYESEYQRFYKSVHIDAFEQHEKEGGINRIIDKVESHKEKLYGQLDFLMSCGIIRDDNDFQWWREQEKNVMEKFDSYTLFGILRGKDGCIYCRNSEGKIEINDKAMWQEVESRAMEQKEIKSKIMERKADNKKEYQITL